MSVSIGNSTDDLLEEKSSVLLVNIVVLNVVVKFSSLC